MTKLPCVAHRPVRHQVVDHAGRRFAPVMVFQIALDRSGRMMRAIPDVVDDGALRRQFGEHPVVQLADIALGKEAARHAGLVGEEEDKISGVVEPADRLRGIRHPADPLLRAHVAVVVIDHAIAVEEGGGPERGRLNRGCSWLRRLGQHALRRYPTTSEAGMSRMQRWSFMVQTGRWQGWHGTTVLVCTVAARPFSGAQ